MSTNHTESAADLPSSGKGARRFLRHFPKIVVTLTLIALALMWLTSWLDRDARNFVTVPLVAGAVLLLGLWFLFFSASARRRRLQVVAGGAAVLVVLALLFRLDGYTGDMVPKIVFRWSPKPDRLLQAPRPTTERREAPTEVTVAPVDLTRTTSNDYPQFLGPRRVPIVTNVTLARDWKAEPPKCLWRQPIGGGWSAFAVVAGFAVTQEQRGNMEMVVCYEVRTGRVRWTHVETGRFTSVLGGDGPRATPTIHGGRVYVQSPRGPLYCLDGTNGTVVWSHDILQENGAANIEWGMSASPLVVNHLVIVSAGGPAGRSLVAYDAETGMRVWSGGSEVASYSSPILATLCGVPQVVVVDQDWVVGHRLSDGETLWRCSWPGNSGANASVSQPVAVGGDRLFLSKGYGGGCKLLQVTRTDANQFAVEVLWRRPTLMKTKLTNVVVRDGYVYGLSQGVLECIDLSSGRRRWKRGRYGHGQVLLVGDLLLVTTEMGAVALVEASPKRLHELGRFQALDGKTWTNPALSGPYLLIRNAEQAACYQLPLARRPTSS